MKRGILVSHGIVLKREDRNARCTKRRGTPEHPGTLRSTLEHPGTLRNTPEHSRTPWKTPEHPRTPEQLKSAGTSNLTVLFCFPTTDHVKKIKCQCHLFTPRNYIDILFFTWSVKQNNTVKFGVTRFFGCSGVPVFRCSWVFRCS